MSVPNHPGFWGGSTVRDGKVRRLPATNWKEFVERIINVPTHFHLTRKEFWSLPSDHERDTAKDGAFVCSCAFMGGEGNETQRNDANATSLVAATLDLDMGDFLLEMEKHPETISEALYPHNCVVWHTAKSRPGIAPRLKVMVEVSPCSPVNLKRFIARIAFLLGIPSGFKGSKESAVTSQAQYRGILFKGETGTHVIASRVNGIPMHISDLPELEPEDEELLNGRTYACDTGDDDEFYGLAYLPVAGLKLEDLREAINTIDPDCERPMWLQVAAALRHQFTDEEEAQEAYEEFVEWSARGEKYKGRKDCWVTWRSLRAYCKGRAPVTVRTIYHYAIAAGWDNTKVAIKLSQTITEWFAQCKTADELMQGGAKQIAAIPFTNAVVEESLIVSWRKRLMALGETIDKATLKRELAHVRRTDRKAKQDARPDELPSWLSPFIYISTLDGFHHIGNGVTLKPAAFDRTYSLQMMPSDETPANGRPVMEPSSYALNVLKMLRVDEVLYDPTQPEDQKIFSCPETGKLLLNSYVHNSVPVADPEFKDQAEALIRELIGYLIKEHYLQEHLLDYLAIQHQTPGVKIPWSFLIQSAPGAGKGTLGEILEATLGPQNVRLISPAMMSSAFNEWAIGSVFGIFNEVHIPGERRDAVMNSLKPLISDPIIAVSLKHRDGLCRVRNFTSYIAFTNEKHATHLAADDRRWCICFSPVQTKKRSEELQASGRFDAIRWLKTPEGASALRYFFLKRKVSPDFPMKGHAPHTIYKAEIIEQSKNTLQVQIEDLIEDAVDPLIGPEVIHEGRLRERVCRLPREAGLLTRYLSLIGYARYDGKRVMLDGCQRGHIWVHTERWQNGVNPVEFLKQKMKDVPELETEEDITFS